MTRKQLAQCASALLMLALFAVGTAHAGEQALMYQPTGGGDCNYESSCPLWNVGPQPFTVTCTFIDPVPPEAVLKSITVHRRLAVLGPLRMYANVNVQLNATNLGWNQILNVGACDYNMQRWSWSIAHSPEAYVRQGTNTVATTVVSACCPQQYIQVVHDNVEPPIYEFRYSSSIDAVAVSGTPQVGVISNPAEQQIVAQTVGPTGAPAPFQRVKFEFVSQPANAAGGAIGADETATSQTFTVTSDVAGRVAATVLFGDKEGDYTIKASVLDAPPPSDTAAFVLTAKKPDRIRIVQDSTNVAQAKTAYAVSLLDEPKYFAVGVDAAGASIGKVRCRWEIVASGPSAGGATVDPAERTGETTFHPSAVGKVKLSANPPFSGVGTAKVDVLIGGVLLDADGNLTASNIHDDLPRYIPGSMFDPPAPARHGQSVPLPANIDDPIQTVKLHVFNGKKKTGSVTFVLSDVSTYQGIAMNYPLGVVNSNPDLDFGAEADIDEPACQNYAPRQCIKVPFSATGDTSVKLYVRDYAARGKVKAAITMGQQVYEQEFFIPKGTTLLPEAGWYALNNATTGDLEPIKNMSLGVAADEDGNPVVSGTPSRGIIGDGLTNLEEYRGFVVGGEHRRLNPFHKDLFLWVDARAMDYRDVLATLPVLRHYIRDNEALSVSPGTSALQQGLDPEINFNRAGIVGASEQRAVHVRWQREDALFTDQTGRVLFMWQRYGGYTFLNGMDPANVRFTTTLPQSPNETRVIDVYDRAFKNDAISMGANGFIDSSRDRSGNPVRPCVSATDRGCDIFDADQLLILPGADGILDTVVTAGTDDYYTRRMYQCDFPAMLVPVIASELELLKHAIVGHEVGHAIDMEHGGQCGDLLWVASPTETMARFLPTPREYSAAEEAQIRLHRKP